MYARPAVGRGATTELMVALRAKFPPQESSDPGGKAPAKEQHEETMAWFERVEAARARNGVDKVR